MGGSRGNGDALQVGVSESEAGFAGDYTEHDGVPCEEFEGVSVFEAEGGLFNEFV